MKSLVAFFALLLPQILWAESFMDSYIKENRGTFTYPKNMEQILESSFMRELENNKNIAQKLGAIKYEMINGNLEKAKIMLLQSQYSDDYSKNVQFRYLGIIHFLEGNYKISQDFLTKKGLYNIVTDDTVCLLRTLNYVLLNETTKASLEWSRCLKATIYDSPTSHIWMNTLLKLKKNDEPSITEVPLKNINIENESGDYLRLFLKMALYLNQQNKIFDRLPYLTESAFKDIEIRELIGMLYYREGKLAKSYEFIEDLDSPNSENIKGNLYLAQKKYQMAYGQYKLALKRKEDSQNALERIIPVAWVLKQWDDGLNFIEKLQVDQKNKYHKLAIKAAFLVQAKKFNEAQIILEQIVQGSNNAQSSEVNQLYAFNSVMLKNQNKAVTYSDNACKFKDGVNCWLQFHLTLWENFLLTLQRDDELFNDSQDLASDYTSSFKENPIHEEIYIDQKDIEELDNDIIQLQPKKIE